MLTGSSKLSLLQECHCIFPALGIKFLFALQASNLPKAQIMVQHALGLIEELLSNIMFHYVTKCSSFYQDLRPQLLLDEADFVLRNRISSLRLSPSRCLIEQYMVLYRETIHVIAHLLPLFSHGAERKQVNTKEKQISVNQISLSQKHDRVTHINSLANCYVLDSQMAPCSQRADDEISESTK